MIICPRERKLWTSKRGGDSGGGGDNGSGGGGMSEMFRLAEAG